MTSRERSKIKDLERENREGIRVARCTVARLMRDLGLRDAMRGKPKRTNITDDMAVRPHDLVIASSPHQHRTVCGSPI